MASASATPPRRPYHIILSHSSLSSVNQSALSSTLGHPAIQYHYADDSPLSLLPQHPNERVLVLDYDPVTPANSVVHSISESLITTGLRLEDAPGALAAEENDGKSEKMFIIETTNDDRSMSSSDGDRKSAQAILAQFKRRNHILRHALTYPDKSLEFANGDGSNHTQSHSPSISPQTR